MPGERARHGPVRVAVAAGWIALFAAVVAVRGVPLDRAQVLAWIVGTLAVVTVLSGATVRRVFVDWLPLAVLLLAYDLTRGAADTLGRPVHVDSVAAVESALFGGHTPTVWLQERVYRHPAWKVAWWEVPVALVYTSHFVVPYVIGAWHWTRGRGRWRFWLRRFGGVTAAGLATFIMFPAAPPWMASRLDAIGPVQRTAPRGWSLVGLDVAERLIDTGQASVNLVAAIPSLHAAHAALVTALFWHGRTWPVRLALLTYPLSMGAVLVLTGEHYVIDVLAGVAVVVAVCWAAGRWERRRRPAPRCRTEALERSYPLLPAGDEAKAERLPDKCTIRLRPGDVLRMLTPGDGGWGPPERPR